MKRVIILVVMLMFGHLAALAQFNAIIYNTGCELADACVGGVPYPDGSKTVEIFWDADNNGPTPNDVQPIVGDGFGECNFNSILLNGEEFLGCAGSFFTDPAFTIVTTTPQPSVYWFRVCDDANSTMWISDTLRIANGLNEYDLSALGGWMCYDSVCGGCQIPPAVQGVQASDASCANVTISWTAYPAEDGMDSLFVYMDDTSNEITRVHHMVTQFVYTGAPEGTRNYLVIARRICVGDTAFSTASSEFGTRIQSPLVPADTSVTVTTHPTQCGAVIVRWRVPNSIASIDSFCVFQNGVEVDRTGPGTAGQVLRDTIFTALAGVQQYHIAGWSIECGHGVQTSQFAGTATQAPAQVTGLTASNGLCTVNLAWTAVPGATSYIVRRNGTQVGTPATNSFSDATATPNTVFSYTVSAFVSSNPPACQEGAQSTSANGWRIGTPNAPTSVIASDSVFCTHVAISWTDNSADEDSFYVRRDGVNIRTVPANTTSYNDSTAIVGTNHNYTVAARNPCGTSAFATVNSGSMKPLPTQVTGVNATDNLLDRVTVTWNNVIRETNFRVLRNGSTLATVAQDVLTYDDMTAVNGVRYQYAVVAFNECGDGATSPADSGGAISQLLIPTDVSAQDSVDCFVVQVTWTDVNIWEDGHFVRRDGTIIGSVPQNVTVYFDSTAIPHATHVYSVAAFNEIDTSDFSSPDDGSLSRHAPPVFGVWATDHLADRVQIGWMDISGETGFRIYRDDSILADVASDVTFYEDFSAIPLEYHNYTVTALAPCGEGIPVSSDIGRIPCVRPSAIQGFIASTGECELTLTWQDLSNEDYYVIFRDGVWRANVGQNQTMFVDDQTVGNTTYSYYMYGQNSCAPGPFTAPQQGFRFSPPSFVTGVAATDSLCGQVEITWNDVDYEDGYMIRRNGTVIGFTQPNVTSFTFFTATGRSQFRVQAFNPCGASFNSLPDSGGTDVVPSMISLATSSPDCDGITLSYAASLNTDSVRLWRDEELIAVLSGGIGSYEDFPPGGGEYLYSAQAVGDCGSSNVIANISGILFDYPLGPTEITAEIDSCETITLSWPSASGDFGYYELLRNDVLIATLPNTALGYNDETTVGGIAYTYTIVAVNDTCGASTDSISVEVLQVSGTQPAAPDVVITMEGLDAHLSWAVVDTSVGGCAVSGLWYAVFYSPTSGGPFYYHGWTADTSYTHLGVVNFSPTQFYQVMAVEGPVALASSLERGMEMGEAMGKLELEMRPP